MSKQTNETWLCVICSLKRFPHGQPCPTWQTDCVNREHAHMTGRWYLENMSTESGNGVGISEIMEASKHEQD